MKNKFIVIYYSVLLLVLSSWKSVSSEPPLVLRLAFLFAVIAPTVFTRKVSYPAIITIFLTIGHYGFAYSYMPYMTYIYGLLTLVLTFILLVRRQSKELVLPLFFLCFSFYIFIIDTITGLGNSKAHFPEDVTWCFLMLLCFFFFAEGNEKDTKHQLSIAFAVISAVLSLYFLLYRATFVRDYGYQSGLERSGWADPNYFGMIIGMGTMIGIIRLLDGEWKTLTLLEKTFYVSVVLITVPTLILNASRGAVLAVLVGVTVLMLSSKAKFGYKMVLLVLAIIGIVFLYQNQYFDLLEYRIENDEGTGSGRTTIWKEKIEAFSQGKPVQWLFGFGYTGGFYLTGRACGFHNEYLAFLVDYGIAGAVSLLYMLYYPIKKTVRKSTSRPIVISLVVYLFTCCLTLEPFTHALLAFFAFYFYAIIVAKDNQLEYYTTDPNKT